MSSLVAGVNGAVIVSTFSSELIGTFVLPRTVPATAVLLTEPIIPIIPRQSNERPSSHHFSCPRPVINVGAKINTATKKISQALERFKKVIDPILSLHGKISATISNLKTRVYQKLGLMCFLPKLIRPFQPYLEYTRCKLGLNEDEFMEPPPCNISRCIDPKIEDREITRDLGLPNLDSMVDGMASTLDDCFDDMEKVDYGARVLAKLVDDESCDDPRYESICKDLISEDRIILDTSCQSQR